MTGKLSPKETFQEYERLSINMGQSFAGQFFLNCPPPWEEETYYGWINKLMESVVCVFDPKITPAFTKQFIEHMQMKTMEGWETRIVQIVDAAGPVSEVYHDRH